MARYNNKKIIMLCPVCGTELHITNQREFRCKCLNKFVVLGSGKDKQLIKAEDAPAARKAMQVRCRDCLSCRQESCTDNERPKRKIDINCLRICNRFKGGGDERKNI